MSRRRAGLSFRRQRRKFNLPLFKEIVSWVVELIVVIGLAYVLVSFFGIRTNVVGQAMEQTLENDDNILVNRFAYIMSKPKAVQGIDGRCINGGCRDCLRSYRA